MMRVDTLDTYFFIGHLHLAPKKHLMYRTHIFFLSIFFNLRRNSRINYFFHLGTQIAPNVSIKYILFFHLGTASFTGLQNVELTLNS